MPILKCSICGEDQYILAFDPQCRASKYNICESCKRKQLAAEGKDINTSDLETIVCPHCGYEMDSFDARTKAAKLGTDTETCPECQKEFQWISEVELTFSTNKIEKQDDE